MMDVVGTLIAGAIMGLFGQGVRALVGLKSLANLLQGFAPGEYQKQRLGISLFLGILVGIGAAVVLAAFPPVVLDWRVLIGFAAAAYIGVDILEHYLGAYLYSNKDDASAAGRVLTSVMVRPDLPETLIASFSTPKQLVYAVMHELLPYTKISGETDLADIGYDDAASKDIIRSAIDSKHWHGVQLGFGALAGCDKIKEVIAAVAKGTRANLAADAVLEGSTSNKGAA